MNSTTTDQSTTLLRQMAEQAVSDKNLLAFHFNEYGKKMGVDWQQLGQDWNIQSEQFTKLALCRYVASSSNNDADLNQIAAYTGVEKQILKQLLQLLENDAQKTKMAKSPILRKRSGVGSFKRRGWAVAIAVLIFLFVTAFVMAQPLQGTEATLVVSAGQATVTQRGFLPLVSGEKNVRVSAGQVLAVQAGDMIALGNESIGQLRLFGGSTVDLAGGTSLEVTELSTDESTYRVRLTMLAGRTVSRVVRTLGIGDTFEIRTPSSTASVRGTVFTVQVIAQNASYFSCDEGVVNVVLGVESVDVHPGEEVNAVVGRPLIVQPQAAAEPTPAPTPATRPTPTAVPTAVPTPTEEPTKEPTTELKTGKSSAKASTNTIAAQIEEIVSKETLDPSNDEGDPSTANNPDPEKDKPENTPNSPSQVPGKPPADTPGNGNPPDAGGLPPGQGGTPPGQEDKEPNGNNGGGGGKKDK